MAKSTAVVKWFNDKKGYGFLIDEEGLDRFVHYRSIQSEDDYKSLKENQRVEYTPIETDTGLAAVEVVPI